MDVSIIVVHYNTPNLTKNCLSSIFRHTHSVNFEVIVVDNASTIHDSSELKDLFPQITLIKSQTNLGFAAGNNLGIQYAKGNYILLLNSDAELTNNAVNTSYSWILKDPRIGVMSCRLNFSNGAPQSTAQRFPSLKYILLEFSRLIKVMPVAYRSKIMLGAFCDHKEIVEVDWVWGAFFLFPREVLNKFPQKKLDDRFFMYTEDMLWCWQVKQLGYSIWYNPEISVTHHMGGSNAPHKQKMMQQHEDAFLAMIYPVWKIKLIKRLHKLLYKGVSE